MKKKYGILLIIIFFFVALSAQIKPPAPVFYKVTVNPFENSDSIIWYRVQNADYYRISVIRFDNPLNPPYHDSIGYTLAPDTVFVNENTTSDSNPTGYSVMAVDMTGGTAVESNFNVPDSTVHLSAAYDSCSDRITFTWNDYNTWRGNTQEYRLYDVREGEPLLIAEVEPSSDRYLQYELNVTRQNRSASFYTEAVHNDGRISVSNLAEVRIHAIDPFAVISEDHVVHADDGIRISFSVVDAGNISKYVLLRSVFFDTGFYPVNEFNGAEITLRFTDTDTRPDSVYYYKIQPVDICGAYVSESDVINSIILHADFNGISTGLTWNSVPSWSDSVSFVLYRRETNDPERIDSFPITGSITFTDNLENKVVTSGEYCYQLKAINENHPEKYIMSNPVCITVQPVVRLPNAFIPGNPDGTNDRFRPLFVLEPLGYEITIYNRWGNIVFSGKNREWDGRQNNEYVPEGVYVYHISVEFPEGKKIEKSGHVTVIYR